MKYVLYFFTLALVFTAGMLVGNFYLPAHNTSLATAVSIPDIESTNPALQQATQANAQQSLVQLTQALEACPLVVSEEKENLFNQISLFLTLQDFETKKAVYEAEIAKNILGNRTTSQFTHAAEDYFAAKQLVEQQVDELFPPVIEPEEPAETETTASPVVSLPSTATVSTTDTVKNNL